MLKKMHCLSYTQFSRQLLHLRFKRGKLKQHDVMQPIHKENRTASILQCCTLLTHCGEPCETHLDSQQQRPSIFNKASMNNRASLEKLQVYFG